MKKASFYCSYFVKDQNVTRPVSDEFYGRSEKQVQVGVHDSRKRLAGALWTPQARTGTASLLHGQSQRLQFTAHNTAVNCMQFPFLYRFTLPHLLQEQVR